MTITDSNKCSTFWAKIFIAGPIEVAKQVCRKECMREGLCVTVDPTTYIYTGGEEAGVVVGLINYPRFPKFADALYARAFDLAAKLCEEMHQHSYTVQTDKETYWRTSRKN
jgi:hypothetical protein